MVYSAGAYSLDFSAYNPDYYDFKLPSDYPNPPTGRASNPMPDVYGPPPNDRLVESLNPRNLALGQIVPYEVKIDVNGSTAPEGGVINFTAIWRAVTTSGDNFGFDPAHRVYAAFVDYGDTRTVDNGTEATATITENSSDATEIKGTIEVSGLDDGDTIIVEIWVVLKSELPSKMGGNVQVWMDSAKTADGKNISLGNQTVPLNQPSTFTTVEADVSIVKSDEPDPIYAGDLLTYHYSEK